MTAGYPDPLKGKLLLRKVLRGILRYQGNQRTRRLPVTPEVLLAIRPVLQSWLSSWDFSMIWATFNLAFFTFLRCSKFTYSRVCKFRQQFDLSTDCITFNPSLAHPQRITVYLKSFKTDIAREGQSLTIARTSSPLCIVAAMQEYFLLVRPQHGPLFYFEASTSLPDWLIKVLGHLSSDCYQMYIRTPQSTLESVAPRMAVVPGRFQPI